MTTPTIPALLAAAGAILAAAPLSAHAQSFTNADFETGDMSGWTVTPTFNGQTILQTVEPVDIDGAGPLLATLAARFQVGTLVAQTGQQAGILLEQPLNLTAGIAYLISFNWATNLTPPATTNTEGGYFTLTAGGVRLHTENAGVTNTANQPRANLLEHVFIPSSTGPHQIGVRITRPFFISATTNINQWVDNFQISTVTAGACCFANGVCTMLTPALCAARAGVYSGDNITCAAANCPTPPTVITPFASASTMGGATSTLPSVAAAARTYQAVIAASELAGIPVGTPLTGISWRSATSTANAAPWPAADAAYTQFDLQLSTSNFPPNMLSFTYDSNVGPDAVMVRSGPLTIPAESFPGGAVAPAVNGFGQPIPFTTPFPYSGGDLLITLRHSGHDAASRSLDSISTSGPGYGIIAQAIQSTNNTSATGTVTAFVITQLSIGGGPAPCYANCDDSTQAPVLNVADFGCFLTRYAAGEPYANCDESTQAPVLNVADFGCFLTKYAAGCP